MAFEKIVEMTRAWDRRHKDPSKNCGVHGVDLWMVLKGDKCAVQFVVHTNWQLPHVTEELLNRNGGEKGKEHIRTAFLPTPADLGYHSPKPVYKNQPVGVNSCPYLGGKPCYYSGSGVEAEKVYKILLEKGSDAVWCELKKYYTKYFG